MSVSKVRGLVPRILEATGDPALNARDEIDRLASGLDERDTALLMRITLGAMKARGMLAAVLKAYSGVGLAGVERKLQPVLLSALYELIFLERVPAHAVVFEAVELAKQRGGRRAAGFANAVLRKARGGVEFTRTPGGFHGSSEREAPLGGGRYALFDRDVFADCRRECARHLAEAHSHPQWLVERWLARMGIETAARVLAADNEVPAHFLRRNPGRPLPAGLAAYLEAAGVRAEPGFLPDTVRVRDIGKALKLGAFSEGAYTVQDETAAAAARLAEAGPGDLVLDACAAPGGKTAVLAPAAGPGGMVAAMDVQIDRLGAVARGMERLGLDVPILAGDAIRPPFSAGSFDVVVLDVPCSNTGVLGRRPEARWRITPEKISALAASQKSILRSCAGLARRAVLYSTCSIEPEENQELVREFERESGVFRIAAERFALPGFADGGYAARLERKA